MSLELIAVSFGVNWNVKHDLDSHYCKTNRTLFARAASFKTVFTKASQHRDKAVSRQCDVEFLLVWFRKSAFFFLTIENSDRCSMTEALSLRKTDLSLERCHKAILVFDSQIV